MSLDSNKGLRQDVSTRWNSTYLMLASTIHYRRAFVYLEMTNPNNKFCPSAFEWENVNDISRVDNFDTTYEPDTKLADLGLP
jgi:hypothetical protein